MRRLDIVIYKGSICLFFILILFSCNNSAEEVQLEDTTPLEQYSFDEIIFFAEGSTRKETEEFSETFIFRYGNEQDGTWIKTYPLIGVNNTSHFESENNMIYYFFRDSIYVKTPVIIQQDSVVLGGSLWRFSHLDIKEASSTLCDSLYVEPKTKITVNYFLIKNQQSVNFRIKYTNKNTLETNYIDGKWIGDTYSDFIKTVEIEPYK